jgi:hypothetical protein
MAIRVDQDEARLLGLSSLAVRAALNTAVSGAPVTQVRVYLIDVVVRVADERRSVRAPAFRRTRQQPDRSAGLTGGCERRREWLREFGLIMKSGDHRRFRDCRDQVIFNRHRGGDTHPSTIQAAFAEELVGL